MKLAQYHLSTRGFLIRYGSVSVLFVLLVAISFQFMRGLIWSDSKEALIDSHKAKISVIATTIEDRLKDIKLLTIMLQNSDFVRRYISATSPEQKLEIQKSWMNFVKFLGYGRSIRLIDDQGWEVIRVDYDARTGEAQLPAQYQYNGQSVYFSPELFKSEASIVLKQGLLEEFGATVRPYQWVWNFVIPFETDKAVPHILVLTAYLDDFVDKSIRGVDNITTFEIVNKDGFFIYGGENHKLYGELIEGRSKYNLSSTNHALWELMQVHSSGMYISEDEISIFHQISLWNSDVSPVTAYSLATINEAMIVRHGATQMRQVEIACFIMVIFSLVLALPIAWVWGHYGLMRREQILADAAFKSTSPMLITDHNRIILHANPSFIKEFGFTRRELVGYTPSILRSGDHDEAFFKNMSQCLDKKGHWDGEVVNRHKDGRRYTEFVHIDRVSLDSKKKSHYYVANYKNISERKDLEDRLRKLSVTDPMTGVFNRRHFEQELKRQWENFLRYPNNGFSLAILDIDFFKRVNDKYGHDVGDSVIRRFSNILEKHLRKVDILARIGGEEFAIILPQTHIDGAMVLMERVRHAVESNAGVPKITCSIGVAESVKSDSTIFKMADKALYDAKETGRNRVCRAKADDVAG